jgi:hypothetical protein
MQWWEKNLFTMRVKKQQTKIKSIESIVLVERKLGL